jgi:hypothetical protein
MDEYIRVALHPGWPIVLTQKMIYGPLDNDQFRIACAYLARDEGNEEAFENLVSQYDPNGVAAVIAWLRENGVTRNG